MPIKFYYIYILRSLKDGLFYIGYSDDLRTRVKDHNAGKNVSAKNHRPLELIFYEAYPPKPTPCGEKPILKLQKGKLLYDKC